MGKGLQSRTYIPRSKSVGVTKMSTFVNSIKVAIICREKEQRNYSALRLHYLGPFFKIKVFHQSHVPFF